MTGLRSTLGKLVGGSAIEIDGAPAADLSVAPESAEQIATLLDFASEHGLTVLPWGSGRHQGFGGRIDPDVIVSTSRLAGITEWIPDDLTVVLGSGATLGLLHDQIWTRRQSAILPETSPEATIGGVIAAGVSGWKRLRYGPTRDRLLQVKFVTGDGRVVTGGARVVKNVTGYDLPRLLTGSFGSLGIITSVCLKLWPVPEALATVATDDPDRALAVTHRPQAVLETPDGVSVYLAGTAAEVEAQAAAVGGEVTAGHSWPDQPAGECVVCIRVTPVDVASVVTSLTAHSFVAAHGVGEVVVAVDPSEIEGLRRRAEAGGGAVVVERAPQAVYGEIDPWGTPPATIDLQRRIKAAFDPLNVLVAGRLPGNL
ncbi:MAG: FAD-binding oxidoreductase [Acidobacteria bacterium]|nr:FAD-binding oxidoreductase [Acidobacteriota bacterium]